MNLLPYANIELESSLTAEEATLAVASAVEPKRCFRFVPAERPVEGTVSNGKFSIQLVNAKARLRVHGHITLSLRAAEFAWGCAATGHAWVYDSFIDFDASVVSSSDALALSAIPHSARR